MSGKSGSARGEVWLSAEELGPPAGPGRSADTLYAFLAEDGSEPDVAGEIRGDDAGELLCQNVSGD